MGKEKIKQEEEKEKKRAMYDYLSWKENDPLHLTFPNLTTCF